MTTTSFWQPTLLQQSSLEVVASTRRAYYAKRLQSQVVRCDMTQVHQWQSCFIYQKNYKGMSNQIQATLYETEIYFIMQAYPADLPTQM